MSLNWRTGEATGPFLTGVCRLSASRGATTPLEEDGIELPTRLQIEDPFAAGAALLVRHVLETVLTAPGADDNIADGFHQALFSADGAAFCPSGLPTLRASTR